jgi:hypothetical protein
MVTPDERSAARRLLDDSSPAGAFAAYYALHHDPKRTTLFIHRNRDGQPDGLLVRAQTGMDLFRPVVVARAALDEVALDLFKTGLLPGRPYYLVAPLSLANAVNRCLIVSDPELLRIYRLDPAKFDPELNVLVVANPAPDGSPRFEISSQGAVQAAAGVNWRSPRFAEVYVYTEPAARGRGWGKSVTSALVGSLLKSRLTPLYFVDEQNSASIKLAESIGFVDTGEREYAGQVMLRQ